MFDFLFVDPNVSLIVLLFTALCGIRYYFNFLFEELTLINSILCIYFFSLILLLQLNMEFIGVIFCIIYIGFVLVLIIHMIRFFAGFGSVETIASYQYIMFLLLPFLIYISRKYHGAYAPNVQPNYVVELDLLKSYEALKVDSTNPLLSQVSDFMFSFDGLITLACVLTLLTATIGVIILNKYGNKK